MRNHRLSSVATLLLATAMLCAGSALADPPGRPPPPPGPAGGGHHYARYYPPPGHVVHRLPPGYHVAHHRHERYYYGGGVWYRPYGPYFTVIAPPIGIGVSFLPNFYTTVWFGGVPYYYANTVYYVRRPDGPGYVVTEPPGRAEERGPPPAASTSDDFYMYPREGQSEERQARDRYECHRWAVSETGFDPSEPGGGVPTSENASARGDYLRAISACLDARGYTVR